MKKAINSLFIAALFFLPLQSWSAAPSCHALFSNIYRSQPEIKIFKASRTLSQRVRDNARDYWHYAREDASFGELSQYQGLAVGDTHPGNFIVSRLNNRMRFFIADIKDSGRAPFIYDLARLVMSTHTYLKGNIKLSYTTSILLSAYLKGLRDRRFETPESIKFIFDETLEQFNQAENEYAVSKSKNNKFKFVSGKVEDIPFRLTDPRRFEKLQKDITKAVLAADPNAEILDYATRPRERGGSADMNRFWALTKNNSGYRIYEFKQIGEPSTAEFQNQPTVKKRYDSIFDTFWQMRDPMYSVLKLDGLDYMMRPKKTDVFSVPYSGQKPSDIQFGLEIAAYDAYYLGKLHGRQMSNADYATRIEADTGAVVDSLREFSKNYISHLEKSIENKGTSN
jgi:hypothetical protein